MKLFKLINLVEFETTLDVMQHCVVRAPDESSARYIASENAGDEGADVWMRPATSSCEEVPQFGNPELICKFQLGF